MRVRWGFCRSASFAMLLCCWSGSAAAQLLVAAPAGELPGIEHAELAYAHGDGPPVTWLSLRSSGKPLAIVAALPPGAVADAALDAWLEALETTASPRLLLPRDASDCGDAASYLELAWPRGRGAPPDELELRAAADVTLALSSKGLELAGTLPPASSYVLWSWPASGSARTTRTFRVQGGAAPLPFLPGSLFPVLFSAVTRGPASYAGEVEAGALGVTFIAGPRKRSDYFERVASWLELRDEPMVHARSRGLLFDWSIQAELVSVAPLVKTYASRAGAERAELDVTACSAALSQLRAEASLDAAREACAGADDAWLALQAADPLAATLQRFVVPSASGLDPALLTHGGELQAPLLRALRVDDAACTGDSQPTVVIDPLPRAGEPSESGESGEQVTEAAVVVEERYHEVDCGSGVYVEPAAPGDYQEEPDEPANEEEDEEDEEGGEYDGDTTCSSDTSSSSSDADCSSDSSSSSSSDADCSSDSSSSSSAEEADCSSDSSSTSSDEGGCSSGPDGEQDSGYDGETCTGSAAPARTQQALTSRGKRLKRPARVKTSLWSVGFAALALTIRRRKRAP